MRALLDASYLSGAERRNLRIEHGVFDADDLDTPARVARAALITGQFTHPVFQDQTLPAADRAEAALRAGEPARALELLAQAVSTRSMRLRAQALYDLGLFDRADAALDPLVERLASKRVTDGDELAQSARALMVRGRIRGSAQADAGDFRTLLSLVTKARDELSPLSWRVRLAEAELLYEKHNLGEARAAAGEALARNPSSADTLALLGRLAVDGFDFDAAELIAARLDELASIGGPMGERAGGPGSPHAGLIRARIALRQRLFDQARGEAAGVLERFAEHRPALALLAAAEAIGFDDTAVDRALARIDALSPGSASALFEVGSALSEARQYEQAERRLRSAIERQTNWSAPRIELGLLLLQSGNELGAIDELEAAVALDPFNLRAANSLKLARDLSTYQTIESEHFTIRYTPPDAVLAREMPAVLEAIHKRVTRVFDHEPAHTTVIELMPDHASFSVRIAGMPKLHTMAAATGPVIALESPREGGGKSVGAYDWARTIQHEYAHTVTLSRTRNRIPHWFTEAAAVYAEDAPRQEMTWRLLRRAWLDGELFGLGEINTAFVRPKKPTDRAQAYAQGHWMYQFIVERFGSDAPLRLMDEYATGQSERKAIPAVLGVEPDAFMEAFETWGELDLRAHGLLAGEGEMTVEDLILLVGVKTPDAAWALRELESHPDHPGLLAIVCASLGEREPALLGDDDLAILERYASMCPVAELPRRVLVRAHIAGGSGPGAGTPRLASARVIEHLVFLDAREQHNAIYSTELAMLHAQRGDLERAVAASERTVVIEPFNPAKRELAARMALLAKRYDTAERHLNALAELEPGRAIHKQRLEALKRLRSTSQD